MMSELDNQNQQKPFTFEQFQRRNYSNFSMYFWGKPGEYEMSDAYRKNPIYQAALQDSNFQTLVQDPELQGYDFSEFDIEGDTKAVEKTIDATKHEKMERKLYEGYLIMRKYAKSDRDLSL